jgi:hypothetical protein
MHIGLGSFAAGSVWLTFLRCIKAPQGAVRKSTKTFRCCILPTLKNGFGRLLRHPGLKCFPA